MKESPKISFVIPAKNEEKSVPILYKEIVKSLSQIKLSFEIIFIDDGSTDNTFEVLKGLHDNDSRVKVIKHRGNFGKSIALQTGFTHSNGEIIITMDADLQDNPREIPKFIAEIEKNRNHRI